MKQFFFHDDEMIVHLDKNNAISRVEIFVENKRFSRHMDIDISKIPDSLFESINQLVEKELESEREPDFDHESEAV